MTRYKQLQNKYHLKVSEPISEWIKRVAAGENLSIRTIQKVVKEGSENFNQSFIEDSERILSPVQEHRLAVSSAFRSPKNMWVVISDVHIPAENQDLMNAVFNLLKDYKHQIKGFIIAGDFLDCYGFSTHSLNQVQPEGYSMELEYELGNMYLDQIDNILPEAVKIFTNGNHEDRYNRYFKNVNTNVLKDITPSPKEALKLKERGYQVLENWKEDSFRIGNLEVFHGQYLNANAIKTHMNKAGGSVMYGHSHRVGSLHDNGASGFNIGWLGNPDHDFFKYASRFERASWVNGFAVVYELENNGFQVNQITCQNNKFMFGGKLYE